MIRCLIIDKMHESITKLLSEIGVEGVYQPDISRDELLAMVNEYDGLIVRSKTTIDRELIAAATKLKFVARAGAGVDQVDLKALDERGIVLLNAPEGNRDALAEHTIGMLLAMLNKLHTADRDIRQFIWNREHNRGFELMGKTVAIIGYGYMGEAVAKRLLAFGCRVLVYDKYKAILGNQGVEQVSLDRVFKEADILSLHVPLTEETKAWVNRGFINSFEKEIFIVNTARGEVLVLNDLLNALEKGKVKAAALDVLEQERFELLTVAQRDLLQRLFQLDQLIFSPHVGGWTHESYYKINQVLVKKISDFLFGH